MPIYELAALGAAVCWATTGLLATRPVADLGPIAFNFRKQVICTIALIVIVVIMGRWQAVNLALIPPVLASGLVGIFLGDTLLFLAFRTLGPRRTGAIFALNAPIAGLLGWAFLGETISLAGWLGIVMCASGVAICVLGRGGSNRFETVDGRIAVGVALGLLAALCQAIGSLIARPVMEAGMDPFLASLLRVAVGAMGLALVSTLPLRQVRPKGPLSRTGGVHLVASAIMSMVVGMTLLLFALQGGKVGIVSTLSALTPVVFLPIMWAVTGERPTGASWLGALIAVAGMALIFMRGGVANS
ncbi:MAG: EamA family transporter [Paracoccus denitrificans]|nr:MAG: EamA family transporter [Paracoccus denitrificans]PZO85213.1 MAG: EamA family transporter [Paracoccus denitrificans]